jgi:hypothetical protein
MFIPKSLTDHKPVTVTVTLPTSWIAEWFLDWVALAFPEAILGNEGQHLKATAEERTIIFERERGEG